MIFIIDMRLLCSLGVFAELMALRLKHYAVWRGILPIQDVGSERCHLAPWSPAKPERMLISHQ